MLRQRTCSTSSELPDDPALLKRLMTEQMARHAGTIEQIRREAQEQLDTQLDAQRERLEAEKQAAIDFAVKAAVDAVLRRFYGPKSERFDPLQLVLFGIYVDTVPLDAPDTASIEDEAGEKLTSRAPRNRHNHGRGKLPEHLPRVRIVHDLTDEQKKCPCCATPRHRIGEEVSEQLERFPANFKVLQHVRITYACKACEQNASERGSQVVTAEKPAQFRGPIEKGLVGPGLLAYVVTGKMADHLPLYRLESIFERDDIHIARSTMCAWMLSAAVLVRPLVELMANRIRQSRVIHTDDTVVPVQQKIQCSKGRLWTHFGDRNHPYIYYDYTPDRSGEGPAKWFADYKGYLQADAYSVYDSLYKRGDGKQVIECGCWAHCRRKYFDAKETDGRRAMQLLAMVRDLYAVESDAKTFTDDARLALRQSRSVPILATIKAWLEAERPHVLPRSPMGEAMTYMANQWDALNVYTTQGFLNIDNNAAERSLKRVAIGRNYAHRRIMRSGQTPPVKTSLFFRSIHASTS